MAGSNFKDGVFYSPFSPVLIPEDPFLDVTTFLFSPDHGDKVALIDSPTGETTTYTQLRSRVFSLASGLTGIGMRQGDVAMIIAPNSIHYPVCFLGILALGGVVTCANPLNSSSEIAHQAKDSKAKYIVTIPNLVEKVSFLELPFILIGSEGSFLPQSSITRYADLLKAESRNLKAVIKQTDCSVILYSSGTTGVSKGVILSHGNVIAATAILNHPSQLENEHKTSLCIIPLFHIYGICVLLCGQIYQGSTLLIMPRYDFVEMLSAIQRYRVTHCSFVPPILVSLIKEDIVLKYDLTSIKVIGSGAAPTSEGVVQTLAHRVPNTRLKQGYGLTESCGIGSYGPRFGYNNIQATGRLAANLKAKIVDVETGKPLPPNGTGEICLQGPCIMQGYLNNSKANAEAFDAGGWLHTGDLGYIDEDGWVYIVDRLKELIKYNGFQVAPAELEAILLKHSQILDTAVVPFADERTGQIPVAFVVRREDSSHASSVSEADIIDFVATKVAPHKKIRKVVFVSSIPKSSAGKILRRELQNLQTSKL